MASEYLLDTNTASFIIKGNIPSVRRRLTQVSMGRVAISAVTEGELRFGVARRPDATRLEEVVNEFLAMVTILPWSSIEAREYARLRAALERAGRVMGNLDMMIAAHALATGRVLVTNHQAFKRIKDLKLEDWTKARGS